MTPQLWTLSDKFKDKFETTLRSNSTFLKPVYLGSCYLVYTNIQTKDSNNEHSLISTETFMDFQISLIVIKFPWKVLFVKNKFQ